MLTIRWNELNPYITQFVLLESNSTFTGLSKPLAFAENRHKSFEFVEPTRLSYGHVGGGGGRWKKGENPFVEESFQRLALDQLIKLAGIKEDDLIKIKKQISQGLPLDKERGGFGMVNVHQRLVLYYGDPFGLKINSWYGSGTRVSIIIPAKR